ncbi:hypothetical protein CRUP_016029 [Coryphaenoides rupestris]|nr:hypothetical protein CRUP_016029 [Coryphaenoides rupestris]
MKAELHIREESRLRLWNVSSSKNVLQLPSIFHHLPHLLANEGSLQPAVHCRATVDPRCPGVGAAAVRKQSGRHRDNN